MKTLPRPSRPQIGGQPQSFERIFPGRRSRTMNASEKSTRRTFLREGGAATLATAIPLFVPRHVLGSPTTPGASGQIVLGIVGMGQRGNQLLANIPASGRVAAICDVTRKTAAALANHKADWKVYRNYRQMVDKRDLDAIIVCPCDHHHVLAGILACQAGKDVYCEKPLSLYIREGRALVNAARKHKRVVQTGTQQRSMEMDRFACEFVRGGGIGKFKCVGAVNYMGRFLIGRRAARRAGAGRIGLGSLPGARPFRPFDQELTVQRQQHGRARWFTWQDYSGGWAGLVGARDGNGAVRPGGRRDRARRTLAGGRKGPPARVHFRYANGVEVPAAVLCAVQKPPRGPQAGPHLHRPEVQDRDQPQQVHHESSLTSSRTLPIPKLVEAMGGQGTGLPKGHVAKLVRLHPEARVKPRADVEIGHRTATLCQLLVIVRHLGRRLQWNPQKEEFTGDEEANKLRDRPRRKGWELPDLG